MKASRGTVGVIVIATLAVVGLGLTAATITSTYSADIGTGPDGPGDSTGDGNGGAPDGMDSGDQLDGVEGGSQSPLEIPQICIEILTTIPAILGMILGFLLLVVVAYRQKGFIAAGFVGYLLGLPLVVGYGLVTQCGSRSATGGEGEAGVLEQFTDLAAGAAGATTIPPVVLAGIFAVAAIVAIGVIASASRSNEVEIPEADEDEEPGLEEFAAVAGEAADRIESTDASVDNAVYRAWLEMTTLLDLPDPDTSTAGEFADAAIEAGLDEDNVGSLTRLFEEVRYGDMDPQPREELALETLRSIEETYGDIETTDDADDGEHEARGNGDDDT